MIKMVKQFAVLYLFGFAASSSAVAETTWNMFSELTETEMSGSFAQDGIALDITLRANANADGTPIAAAPFNGCAGNNNPCKLALEFAGRAGQWMVLKDYYYVLSYSDLYLDAGSTPAANTIHRDPGLTRFKDPLGNTMLENPNDQPALEISFPDKPGYQDMKMSLHVGRVAAEYTGVGGCSVGYLCDNATGSALGLRIANAAGTAAGINVDGKVYVFGF